MRVVVQRVREAHVVVSESTTGAIGAGLLVFLGVSRFDTAADADYLVKKLLGLRVFPDDAGKMNRNVSEAGGAMLVISQFTLYGDCSKGRRPSFDEAAPPDKALALYDYFVNSVRSSAVPTATGIFQAHMQVHLVNDGPVTILIDSPPREHPS